MPSSSMETDDSGISHAQQSHNHESQQQQQQYYPQQQKRQQQQQTHPNAQPNQHHHYHQHRQQPNTAHHSKSNTAPVSKTSSKSKCDQIVYEAIAKAAEIVVRGRCDVPPNSKNSASNSHKSKGSTAHGAGGGSTSSAGSGNANAKFQLEVEEVHSVRSILQSWKKSLNIPLRLDVYYQYCTDATQPEQTTRKELLERWCIDYLPTEHQHKQPTPQQQQQQQQPSVPSSTNPPSSLPDETIAQLHLVCKHLVILLRTLYSFTRILPAYRLHQAFLSNTIDGTDDEEGTMGAGGGGGGGYYPQQTPPPNLDWGKNKELLGGKILFSFYVSDKPPEQHQRSSSSNAAPNTKQQRPKPDLTEDTAPLISSSSGGPFARHDLQPVPTPFGFLHLTALYDSTLDVEDVLARRATRWGLGYRPTRRVIGAPRTLRGIGGGGGGVNGDGEARDGRCVSGAIPIQNNPATVDGAQYQKEHHKQYVSQIGCVIGDGRSPMSTSPGYRTSAGQETNDMCLKDEIRTNNNRNQREGLTKKQSVPSGLSLALMNLEQQEQAGHQERNDNYPHHHHQEQQQRDASLSPGTTHSKSSDGASSLRQRMAFHHPPPSFGNNTTTENINIADENIDVDRVDQSSISYRSPPSPHYYQKHTNHTQTGSLSPLPCGRKSPGLQQYKHGLHSSPMSINTPPQPVFIGSLPRRFSGGGPISTSAGSAPRLIHASGDDQLPQNKGSGNTGFILKPKISSTPPFRNPISLQLNPLQGSNVGTSTAGDNAMKGGADSNDENNGNRKKGLQGLQNNDILLPPLTSMDMLSNNPFKSLIGLDAGGTGNFNGSIVSSLSLGMGSTAYYGPNDESASISGKSYLPNTGGIDSSFRSTGGNVNGGVVEHVHRSSINEIQDVYEDMPFAVDIESTSTPGGLDECGGSGFGELSMTGCKPGNTSIKPNNSAEMSMNLPGIGASQSITSLAHRCSTAGRLKLFCNEESDGNMTKGNSDAESGSGTLKATNGCRRKSNEGSCSVENSAERTSAFGVGADETIASLASKLAEFHTFEDSLIQSGIMGSLSTGGGGGDVSATCVESS